MKINLSPVTDLTEAEKKALNDFTSAMVRACNEVSDCERCPLYTLRDNYNLNDSCPDFIYDVLTTLGIS